MAAKPSSLVLGKWRIFESDLCGRDFLDLVEPAYIRFDADGHGEFMFGCVSGGLDCGYAPNGASFTWEGSDEMDEARGDGDADLDDDILTIELSFHRGDEAVLKARRWDARAVAAGRASSVSGKADRKPRRQRPRS